jgi:hypothetical protein
VDGPAQDLKREAQAIDKQRQLNDTNRPACYALSGISQDSQNSVLTK